MTELLTATDLIVHYGPVQALRGVSLTVNEGEMVALVGANGAGKTTTMRTLTGLIAPTSGTVTLDGNRIDGLSPHRIVRQGVAHLPEGRELFGGMTVLENLQLGAWTAHDPTAWRTKADEMFGLFPRLGERATQAAGTLSGGEQQMLGVARALMSSPRLLVIDELSLGLAPKIVAQLFDILATVNSTGTAVILVEQFVHMALAHTNRAYVMAKGEVVAEGPSRQMLDDPSLVETYLGQRAGSH